MKKVLDRSALQLAALCPGLVRPGFCTHTHHRLGWASASPRLSPSFLGTDCGMPLESATLQGLLSHTSWCGRRCGDDTWFIPWALGGGMEGTVGPPRQAGHPLSDAEQELWTLKVWREEEATFTEHPAWSWAFSGKKDQAIRCPWSPPQGGGTCLGGITETAEPGRSRASPPQDSIRFQWTSWGGHFF